MYDELKGKLATTLLRFFVLLLFVAGAISGMASVLFLGKVESVEALIVILLTAWVAFGLLVFQDKKETNIARFLTMGIFVAGLISGAGSILLTGLNGAIGLLILLLVVVSVWGLWVFRPRVVS